MKTDLLRSKNHPDLCPPQNNKPMKTPNTEKYHTFGTLRLCRESWEYVYDLTKETGNQFEGRSVAWMINYIIHQWVFNHKKGKNHAG
jgi:hypothetical protein